MNDISKFTEYSISELTSSASKAEEIIKQHELYLDFMNYTPGQKAITIASGLKDISLVGDSKDIMGTKIDEVANEFLKRLRESFKENTNVSFDYLTSIQGYDQNLSPAKRLIVSYSKYNSLGLDHQETAWRTVMEQIKVIAEQMGFNLSNK